jgi:FtsP/CotA-like multicopper oxidase with cupredoxin domain
MMGSAGYRWMMGGLSAPAWMRSAHPPSAMMGTTGDMGQVMGRLWRARLVHGSLPSRQCVPGAKSPSARRSMRPRTQSPSPLARSAWQQWPTRPADLTRTFRIAGLVNPKIIVPSGARVRIQVINADPDAAHGLVITASGTPSSMPASRTAFTGSALWFLGNPTDAGMHTGTLAFTATTPGSYQYLCPVPGHAQKGMAGSFIVAGSS